MDTSGAIRLQARPPSPALGIDGVGEVEFQWLQGPPLTLSKINFDAGNVKVLKDGTTCIKGAVLDQESSGCQLRVRVVPAGKPARIELTFVDRAGKRFFQPVSFVPSVGTKP